MANSNDKQMQNSADPTRQAEALNELFLIAQRRFAHFERTDTLCSEAARLLLGEILSHKRLDQAVIEFSKVGSDFLADIDVTT